MAGTPPCMTTVNFCQERGDDTYVTVRVAAKKVARLEFTDCSELASDESIVSISFHTTSKREFSQFDNMICTNLSEAVKHTACKGIIRPSQLGNHSPEFKPWGVTSCHRMVARTTVANNFLKRTLDALKAPVNWTTKEVTLTNAAPSPITA
jgi:hypothetical protein